MTRFEKSNCYRKMALNMQKSEEAIPTESFLVKGRINSLLIKGQVLFKENFRSLM